MMPYRIIIFWKDGRRTTAAESHAPTALAGAPMVARNARVIRRIELHDLTGSLETIWDASWT
jgi:hypothetical protein